MEAKKILVRALAPLLPLRPRGKYLFFMSLEVVSSFLTVQNQISALPNRPTSALVPADTALSLSSTVLSDILLLASCALS
jgi:hypothetical protein